MSDTTHIGQPGGRPRKDTRKLRDQWLKARVTADEKHRAEQLMRDANKTESDFVRGAVLEGQIVIRRQRTVAPILLHDLGRLAQELSRAGNVVNQVAHDRPHHRQPAPHPHARSRRRRITSAVAEIRPLLKRLHELE